MTPFLRTTRGRLLLAQDVNPKVISVAPDHWHVMVREADELEVYNVTRTALKEGSSGRVLVPSFGANGRGQCDVPTGLRMPNLTMSSNFPTTVRHGDATCRNHIMLPSLPQAQRRAHLRAVHDGANNPPTAPAATSRASRQGDGSCLNTRP